MAREKETKIPRFGTNSPAIKLDYCSSCGDEKEVSRKFYKSNNPAHRGHTLICRDCIKKRIYREDGKIDKQEMKNVLKEMDLPWFEDTYQNSLNNDQETFGVYIRTLNTLAKSKGKKFLTWEDGENGDKQIKQKNAINFSIESDFEVTLDMIRIWGKGYEIEDYEFLENCYQEWSTRYKCDTLAEEKTYRFLSLKELEIRKGREKSENVDKLEETFRKLMSDANVTPRDANAANDPENMNTLGMWIKDIEKYRPAEYFEDKKIYVDYDGFIEYLQRFIFRPLKNLLLGTKDFDKEFNVENLKQQEEEMYDEGE